MTPENRIKIFREIQKRQPKTAEERLNIFREVQQGTAATPPMPQEDVSFLENLRTGAERGLTEYIQKPLAAAGEAIYSGIRGDTRPLQEFAELAGRGLLKTVSAFDPAGAAYEPVAAEQDPAIAQLKAQQQARQEQVDPQLFGSMRAKEEDLARREAADPSLAGRLTRGAATLGVAAIPAVLTGVATGGSVPAIAAVTAGQSLGQPENLALNVGGAVVPVPIGKVVAPILKRIRGAKAVKPGAAPAAATPPATVTEIEAALMQGGKIAELRAAETAAIEAADSPLVQAAERQKASEIVSTAIKAGLLTRPTTHIKNVLGTGLFQLSEEAARLPAVMIDLVMSPFTKQRGITGPSVTAVARSAQEAATRGIKEAFQIIKRGQTDDELVRLGLDREIRSGSKVFDNYVNGVFRVLAAEDKIFRVYATRRSLQERAKLAAISEARQGTINRGEIGRRTREFLDDPTEDLVAASAADAEFAVFANENFINREIVAPMRQRLRQTPTGQAVNFVFDRLVPFTKTPTNILARTLEYSGVDAPIQVARAIFRKLKTGQGFDAQQQREFAQSFGRATVGSAGLITLGYKLAEWGYMTGLYEDERSKTARDLAAGRPPGSIYNPLTKTWHQVIGLAPLGTLMAIGASIQRETAQEREDESQTAGKLLGIATSTVKEQPLMIGIREISELLDRPSTTLDVAGQFAGTVVPSIVGDIAETFDPTQREAKGLTGPLLKKIPGARQTLPERTDVLGQPIEDRGISTFADFTRTTTGKQETDPLMAELVRLDIGLNKLTKKRDETEDDYRARVRDFGQLYTSTASSLLADPLYQNATKAQKQKAFESLNNRVKVQLNDEAEQSGFAIRRQVRLSPAAIMRAVIDSQRFKR